jgi:hypothetical protein
VVTTTADSGAGSLRDALNQVNADTGHALYASPSNPSVDEIDFAISAASDTGGGYNSTTGVATIAPLSALPNVTSAVTIDGWSQPGFAGTPLIELNGAGAGTASGLVVAAPNTTIRGLVINRFAGDGIAITSGSTGDQVQGNYLGLDQTGRLALGNGGYGVSITNGDNNQIDGGNVISANGKGGIYISGNTVPATSSPTGNQVFGNIIGSDVTGSLSVDANAHPLGNHGDGIEIVGSANNLIGGTGGAATRNVISNNALSGIGLARVINELTGPASTGNVIKGNYIGVDGTGSHGLPNNVATAGQQAAGIYGIYASSTTIGGLTAAARNIISANSVGVWLLQGATNSILGNYIGTDYLGNHPLGNGTGILFYGESNDRIGAPAAVNIISANGLGLGIDQSSQVQVQSNLIGIAADGTPSLGNYIGIQLDGPNAANNTIGGTSTGAGNIVAASTYDGMLLSSGAHDNIVQGNTIGGTSIGAGNGRYGVVIFAGAHNNRIDGSGAPNTIAYNGAAGVSVGVPSDTNVGVVGNAILGNSIHDNGGRGIVLSTSAANDNQAAPVLTSASSSGSGTTISGTLQSVASTSFRIEFFANATADPSGYGQGRTYLGFTNVTTDGTGNASFTATLPALPAGQTVLSATATKLVGASLTPNDTSPFSRDVSVPAVGPITAPLAPVAVNTAINVSASFTDALTTTTHTAVWNWGDSNTSAGTVSETNGSGTVTGSHTYTADGVYTVTLTVANTLGGSGQSVFQYVVVYNPSAGFVTGGGWITSPAGAYAANPSLTGQANFGFNAKYKSGATVPTGNTDFQFPAANLTFQSTSYDWLVISTNQAQYQGSGTINGAGSYGFLVTAQDNGGHGADRFRLQIWDKNNGNAMVYDTQPGAATTAAPTTALGGGRIQVHTNAQLVAGGANPSGADVAPLTAEELQPVVQEAIARWVAAGIDPAQVAALRQVTVGIAKFPGPWLGMAFPGAIWIDQTAAGYGWYLDPSSAGDSAFPAAPGSPAYGKVDLLTVVEHELGHELGFGDTTGNDLMGEFLAPGVRRVPLPTPGSEGGTMEAVLAPTAATPAVLPRETLVAGPGDLGAEGALAAQLAPPTGTPALASAGDVRPQGQPVLVLTVPPVFLAVQEGSGTGGAADTPRPARDTQALDLFFADFPQALTEDLR